MDSPLSDINEVIADSEDESTKQVVNGIPLMKATLSKESDERVSLQNQNSSSMADGNQAHTLQHNLDLGDSYVPPAQIDYFAGFQDVDPTPSIADRAKTRQRKSRAKPAQHIIDLTDGEDDLNPKPQRPKSKPKPAPRESGKPSSGGATSANVDSNPPLTSLDPGDSALIVNAKSRIRPRPVKKSKQTPETRTSQSTLAVPTSPFPSVPCQPPADPPIVDLPPSDPPLPSSILERDLDLPQIEILPQPESTGSDLPSSSYHVSANQPRNRKKRLRKRDDVDELEENLDSQPPPTFFAGSSSHPHSDKQAITEQRTAIRIPRALDDDSPDLVDLTALPSSPGRFPETEHNSEKDMSVKKKKAGKSRKKEESIDPVDLHSKKPRKRKPKSKQMQVEVVVHVPPQKETDPLTSNLNTPVAKGKGKAAASSNVEQDELNIDVNHNTCIGLDLQEQSTSSTAETGNLPQEHIPPRRASDNTATNAKSPKPRGRKRKSDIAGLDSSTMPGTDEHPKAGDTSELSLHEEHPTRAEEPDPRKNKRRKGKSNDDGDLSPTLGRNRKGKAKLLLSDDDEADVDSLEDIACDGLPSQKENKTTKELQQDHDDDLNELSQDNTHHQNGESEDQDILRDTRPENNKANSLISTYQTIPKRHETPSVGKYPNLSSRYTVAPRTQSPSVSELIRRVNSLPNSPFAMAPARRSSLSYSPYSKASRTALSRIAPLHPNRHTPPPQPPPPPPKKKSKKELELEEKWEEEIIDEIGGITEWLALSETDKKELRRRKRDREMGFCED